MSEQPETPRVSPYGTAAVATMSFWQRLRALPGRAIRRAVRPLVVHELRDQRAALDELRAAISDQQAILAGDRADLAQHRAEFDRLRAEAVAAANEAAERASRLAVEAAAALEQQAALTERAERAVHLANQLRGDVLATNQRIDAVEERLDER